MGNSSRMLQGIPSLSPVTLQLSTFPSSHSASSGQTQLQGEEREGPATQVPGNLTSLSLPSPFLVFGLWRALKGVLGDVWA